MRTGLADQLGVGCAVNAVPREAQRDPAAPHWITRAWRNTQGTVYLLGDLGPHLGSKRVLRIRHNARDVGLAGRALGPAGRNGTVKQGKELAVTIDDTNDLFVEVDLNCGRTRGPDWMRDIWRDKSFADLQVIEGQSRVQPAQQSSRAVILLGQDLLKITMAQSSESAAGQPTGGRRADFAEVRPLYTLLLEHVARVDTQGLGRWSIESTCLFETTNTLELSRGQLCLWVDHAIDDPRRKANGLQSNLPGQFMLQVGLGIDGPGGRY